MLVQTDLILSSTVYHHITFHFQNLLTGYQNLGLSGTPSSNYIPFRRAVVACQILQPSVHTVWCGSRVLGQTLKILFMFQELWGKEKKEKKRKEKPIPQIHKAEKQPPLFPPGLLGSQSFPPLVCPPPPHSPYINTLLSHTPSAVWKAPPRSQFRVVTEQPISWLAARAEGLLPENAFPKQAALGSSGAKRGSQVPCNTGEGESPAFLKPLGRDPISQTFQRGGGGGPLELKKLNCGFSVSNTSQG